MKFIINTDTLARANDMTFMEVLPVLAALGLSTSEVEAVRHAMTHMEEVTDLKNISVTNKGGLWILEVDDEILFIQARIIGRIASAVAPLISFARTFFLNSLKDEFQNMTRWFEEKK